VAYFKLLELMNLVCTKIRRRKHEASVDLLKAAFTSLLLNAEMRVGFLVEKVGVITKS